MLERQVIKGRTCSIQVLTTVPLQPTQLGQTETRGFFVQSRVNVHLNPKHNLQLFFHILITKGRCEINISEILLLNIKKNNTRIGLEFEEQFL